MKFNLRDFKIFCIQDEYKKYNNILNRIQIHIQCHYKNNLISLNDRNLRMSNLYKIISDINIINKKNLLELEDNNNEINLIFTELITHLLQITNINYKIIYEYLYSLYKLPKHTHIILNKIINNIELLLNDQILFPFKQIRCYIIDLTSTIGLLNLNDLFILYNLDNYVLTTIEKDLIELYTNIYTPVAINELNIYQYTDTDIDNINNNNFFTRNLFIKENNESTHEQLLDNNFIMYLYINNRYFKINGYFKLDPLQINVRLMTLTSYEKIFKKKIQIEQILLDSDIFKRKYLKYCSIQELIIYPIPIFIKYLDIKYKKFNEINNKSLPLLMKNFIGKNMNLINWYEIIKLLLLGTDENINIAGSLYSLLKDKKNNIGLISDIIYDNLVFCNQMKLKKINQTLKIELDKLNEFNYESIDFKKELALSVNMPMYIKAMVMEKINEMKFNNNDYNKQLIYVKTILQFPWPSINDENIFKSLHDSKNNARKYLIDVDSNLNKITYGHKKVKEQISLLITKWISNPISGGSAIGLMGPPGVGKTLIAKSLAKVLDIPLIMITLGGQNDSELLIGHGYTYAGSQPGMIIKKMCEAGRGRCIMYFDELDKSCSKHGSINEITSILIHLTDPNTNKQFQDRFFQGINFPLDKIIFIASYNDSSKIDPILLDRLIELDVKSYNIDDKMNILKDFILPELKENIGINKTINISNEDMKHFIYDFTSESGVRDLKHKTEQILLNINKQNLMNDDINTDDTINLTYELIVKYLGENNKIQCKMISELNKVGFINGLYATSNGGGGITSIEICPISIGENFQLKLTGSMGDVMKESIQVAFTRACSFINEYNENNKYNISNINTHIKNNFPFGFHIHAPEGATPKDGPSAGSAFTVGFISVLLNKPINRLVAMTGEMNLSGQVTKIGGLIYKLIGAKYAGVEIVLVPKQNYIDIDNIILTHPDLFDLNFKYKYINNLSEVVEYSLLN